MAEGSAAYIKFNSGVISPLALARLDVKRVGQAAEVMTNFMPRVLGPMMLRPGLEYIGQSLNNNQAKYVPFIFSTNDTALVEFTDTAMRFWINDELLSRPAVTTTVTNGTFVTNVTGWTDNDEAGAVSDWVSNGGTGGYMRLLGTGTNSAIRDQQITVAGANVGVEHGLLVLINRGPVKIRVGTALGLDDYIAETELQQGSHSMAFTPSGDFFIRFKSNLNRYTHVQSVSFDPVGGLTLADFYTTADLYKIRWDQSGDVLFLAASGYAPIRIERRGARSWSVVAYAPQNGPYRPANTSTTTITASATTGNITLTASQQIFKSTNFGSIYRIASKGQLVVASIVAQNTFSNPIRVEGAGPARQFSVAITGVFVATATLQRSTSSTGPWEDTGTTYAATGTSNFNDELDNQTLYYRIGVKTGDYTSGTVGIQISHEAGSIVGVVRVTAFTSETVVEAEVLSALGGTTATDDWSEGLWSTRRGFPSSVAFYEGRLWWAGKNNINGSVSDDFVNFDPDFEGDAGPINRTIGSGPVDDIHWLLALNRLVVGGEGTEFTVRSSSFDEPITPSNFNLKGPSTQGSAAVLPVKFDSQGAFVQRSGARVYELNQDGNTADYVAIDMTGLSPEIGEPSIVTMAVQRQPDTRIHAVRSDGSVAVAVIDRVEKALSWQVVETDGDVEDVVVLPGTSEDQVFYSVKRELLSSVASLSVTFAGAYYLAPTLTFSGGGGTGATAHPVMFLAGFGYNGGASGTGYTAGDLLTIPGGNFTVAATARVITVTGGGAPILVGIETAGSYFETPNTNPDGTDVFQPTGGTGTGFEVTSLSFGVSSAVVDSGGLGYTSAPTVTATASPAAGATATLTATLSSSLRRFLEKWALESECQGGLLNKQADAFFVYEGVATNTITGGSHLAGKEVVVWTDGIDRSPETDGVPQTYVVTSSGTVTISGATFTKAIAGLFYEAQWKSAKVTSVADEGTIALCQKRQIGQVGFVLQNTHVNGLQFGPDFDTLDPLPDADEDLTDTEVYSQIEMLPEKFNGDWSTDPRLCLRASAPRPCTILAAVMAVEEHTKS